MRKANPVNSAIIASVNIKTNLSGAATIIASITKDRNPKRPATLKLIIAYVYDFSLPKQLKTFRQP